MNAVSKRVRDERSKRNGRDDARENPNFCRDASMIPAKKIKKTLIRLVNGNWKSETETDAEKNM